MPPPDLWKHVEERLAEMCDARRSGRFLPILEADVAGYLYFLFVRQEQGNASRWHLDTRVFGAADDDKFDIVRGDLLEPSEQAASYRQMAAVLSEEERRIIASPALTALLRPAIQPQLILELKYFAPGFTPQQNREHFQHVLEDATRLRQVSKLSPDGRALVLVDCHGYMSDTRCGAVLAAAESDAALRAYVCLFQDPSNCTWRRLK